jgi:transposase
MVQSCRLQAVTVRYKSISMSGKAPLPSPKPHPRPDHLWLTDAEWAFLAPFLLEGRVRSGRPPSDHRRVMNAIFWIGRQGLPWRELPPELGNWNSAFRQYRRWQQHGVWNAIERSLEALVQELDAKPGHEVVPRVPGLDPRHLLAVVKLAQAIQTRPKFQLERMGRRRIPTDDAMEA